MEKNQNFKCIKVYKIMKKDFWKIYYGLVVPDKKDIFYHKILNSNRQKLWFCTTHS